MALVVLGAQWGDEGKGKIVDNLVRKYGIRVVARAQGGHNAGHTVWVGEKKFVLHLIPSGCIQGAISVLGNGMVISPTALLKEMKELKEAGLEFTPQNMLISDRAHLITPWAPEIDCAREDLAAQNGTHIGTTRRGIGPAYEDKAARRGLTLGMACSFDRVQFFKWCDEALRHVRIFLPGKTMDEMVSHAISFWDEIQQIKEFVQDTGLYLDRMLLNHSNQMLFEGAQGTLLDLDHGTYPYVTSSNTTVSGVLSGLGVNHRSLTRVIGIAKAYVTRVGQGPLPTEQFDATADHIRKVGDEYGATTGRPRRIGWFDLHAMHYAQRINGFDEIILTKADVLDGLEVPLGDGLMDSQFQWEKVGGVCNFACLPSQFLRYTREIQNYAGVAITGVSTGPDRDDMCWRDD